MKRTPLKRGKPLNRRSKKHKAANDVAAKARREYMEEHWLCFICLHAEYFYPKTMPRLATEVHHLAGRNAKACAKYEDPRNWMPICRSCHSTVTDDSIGTAQICWDAKKFVTPDDADLAWLKSLRPKRFSHVTHDTLEPAVKEKAMNPDPSAAEAFEKWLAGMTPEPSDESAFLAGFAAARGVPVEAWFKVSDQHPPRHHRTRVRRNGLLFTATPCYGMHEPWWVVTTMDGEAPPVAMRDDDEWESLLPPGANP